MLDLEEIKLWADTTHRLPFGDHWWVRGDQAVHYIGKLIAEVERERDEALAHAKQVSAKAQTMVDDYVGERDFWQKQAREAGDKAERYKKRAQEAEAKVRECPACLELIKCQQQRDEARVEIAELIEDNCRA